ncbi:SDR family NAD(P)-dependent oxidoreductase [Rubrivirga marina]|uniref:Acetoin dehydrogenase n=1 Tax=Rubrivirga marina TaxID=1196024 RepID=A0A271IW36_9BACT|nr:SDR family NAD(P)-dependent oxidoreductase [Rubrivirga marina]PAP75004.1 acetoin dehydrogenase [Rubrivirga marina]
MTRLGLASGVAVVTGAASGIGRATALALARRGCALALVDRDADGLRATADTARDLGVAVSEHVLDVAEAGAVAALPDSVMAEHGRVSVLVNAAGVALAGRVEEVSMDEVRWLMEINFFGLVGLTKAFLPHLRAAGEAQIANLSSLFGIIAPAEQAAYAASKFAVRGFSEALRHELEGTGVGVTVVHPGGVATAISTSARVAAGADADEVARKQAAFERQFLRTPPEAVGEAIADAIEKRSPRLLVASGARSGALLQRLMPVRYWRVLRKGADRLGRG